MPFPKCKIHFNKSFGSCPRTQEIEDKNTGICTEKTEDCNKPLPPSEMFEIQNQIAAGVTLNEVNTKILNDHNDLNIKEFSNTIETITKKSKSKNEE